MKRAPFRTLKLAVSILSAATALAGAAPAQADTSFQCEGVTEGIAYARQERILLTVADDGLVSLERFNAVCGLNSARGAMGKRGFDEAIYTPILGDGGACATLLRANWLDAGTSVTEAKLQQRLLQGRAGDAWLTLTDPSGKLEPVVAKLFCKPTRELN